MKMLKKVFIAALCLAVMISCFAVFASAKEYTTENFKDILEYYEEPNVFDDDFEGYEEGDTYTTNVYNNSKNAQDMTIKANDGDKYLHFYPGDVSKLNTKDMFLNGNFATPIDDFVLKTVISGTSDSKTTIKELIVWLDTANEDIAEFDDDFGKEFIKINFGASANAGTVQYFDAEVNAIKTLEGVTINDTDKFELLLVYSGSTKTYSITVASLTDDTNVASVSVEAVPQEAVPNVKIGSLSGSNATKRAAYIYDLQLYGGTGVRDNAAKQTETEAAITAMHAAFKDTNTDETVRVNVVTIAGKLSKYGFTTTDEVVAPKYNELLKAGIDIYAAQLEDFVENLSATATYADRVAHLNAYNDYAELMPTDLSIVEDEAVAAHITELVNTFNTEKTTLADIKTNSDGFIAALEGADSTSNDYTYLRPIYDEAVKYYDGAYNGYPGVTDAKKTYTAIADVVEILIQNAEGFISNVNEAAANGDFGVRYAAYLVAKEKFVDNTTYPGISEALEIYAVVSEEMVAKEAKAFEFIAYSENAECALYIPAQEAYIALANAIEGVEPNFPGVAEAVALIAKIEDEITEKRAAVAAYIEAVEALEGKTGAELDAAIAEAKRLQASGNILGIEGVEQANIALSNAESAITNANGFANKFNSLVTKLGGYVVNGKITKSYETRVVLLEAISIGAVADDTIAGVSNNRDILNKAISDYNAAINATNSAFAGVCNVAAGVGLNAAANTEVVALVGKAIAFIKELV